MYHGNFVLIVLATILTVQAEDDITSVLDPVQAEEQNEPHFQQTRGVSFNHHHHHHEPGFVAPPPPPPQPFFFAPPQQQNHELINDAHTKMSAVQTNLIEHGDRATLKHQEEERGLFQEVMQNKFEMEGLQNELAEMHRQIDQLHVDANQHDAGVHAAAGRGQSTKDVDAKPKLQGPPLPKREDNVKIDVKQDTTKPFDLFGGHNGGLFSPLINSLGETLSDKPFGQHLTGLAGLVPVVLVRIAARFALASFSSNGLKALASLIPTLAVLLINGIMLFLIWYQDFKARLGEQGIGALFGHGLTS